VYAYYLWFKAGHIAFMVTWFAGLFYLPRLFIYHAEADDTEGRTRFTVMERRLYAIMTIGAILTLIFGLLLIAANSALLSVGWFRVKLVLLVGLAAFHLRCKSWIVRLGAGYANKDTRGLRWCNEMPALFRLLIVGLAVLKPF